MLSKEDFHKSVYYLNRYEIIKIHRTWGRIFMLFGLANFTTSIVTLLVLNSKIEFLSQNYYILLYLMNFVLVIYSSTILVLSFRSKYFGSLVRTIDLTDPKRNNRIFKSPYYRKFIIIILIWIVISGFLNYFSYQTILFFPFPDNIFLTFPYLITGIILILGYSVQRKVYTEISFKEFLIIGVALVFIFCPVLYVCQSLYYNKFGYLFNDLQTLMSGSPTIHKNNMNILSIFLLLSIFPSLILINIGLFQYAKLRKFFRDIADE